MSHLIKDKACFSLFSLQMSLLLTQTEKKDVLLLPLVTALSVLVSLCYIP